MTDNNAGSKDLVETRDASHQEPQLPLIVGLGASAVGLDALTAFCEALPTNRDAAFVIIQDLDTTQKRLMPELLAKHTPLHVKQVRERTKIEPGHLYIIPPGMEISDRQHAEAQLVERERQFKTAIQKSPIPAVVYAEGGEILVLSDEWLNQTGYDRSEINNLSDWIELASQGEREAMDRRFKELMACEEVSRNEEYTIRCKNGDQRVWRFNSSPLGKLPDARHVRVIKALDVTELRRAYDKMEELNHTLEEKVQSRTAELSATTQRLRRMAHELTRAEQQERRRLATTLHDNLQQLIAVSMMQITQVHNAEGKRKRELVDEVRDSLYEAADVCRNLTTELAPTVLYDAGLAKALDWLCEQFNHKYKLEMDCEIDDDSPTVDQDLSVMLFQSVRELLFNVVKHADAKQARIFMATESAGFMKVGVWDDGKGFDKNAEAHTEQDNGSGFGLFSIRERLSVMGGRVEIESDDSGSTVTLIVPTDIDAPLDAEFNTDRLDQPVPSIDPPAEGELIRVLVVDDHTVVRKGMTQLIATQQDMQVVGECGDGEAAQVYARRCRPHVVIMDINMPVMGGIEATRQLMREIDGIKVIGLSVQEESSAIHAMREAGAIDLMTKGGPLEPLWEKIREAVGRS